ncbi:MAG: dihydropteroate synthase, partial [Burkholderiaceae bacterium]
MGIVNVTPDSFSDGGRHNSRELAIAHAHRLLDEGADILDLGGESTRPGAPEVSAADEADRVLPVLEALVATGVPISIDTSKPALMKAALAAGAAIINDVRALTEPGAVEAVAQSD